MKLIEAIIKPVKLEEVKSALQKIGIEDVMESASDLPWPSEGTGHVLSWR